MSATAICLTYLFRSRPPSLHNGDDSAQHVAVLEAYDRFGYFLETRCGRLPTNKIASGPQPGEVNDHVEIDCPKSRTCSTVSSALRCLGPTSLRPISAPRGACIRRSSSCHLVQQALQVASAH